MRHSRGLPSRFKRIAELQALRALASRSELVRAQEQQEIARAALAEADQALADRAAEVERMFGGASLDIAALGIGRAILATLARERTASAAELETRQVQEDQRRRGWNIDRNLETRARDLHRKANRLAAQKREDAASLEATLLRFVHAQGARP